MLLVRISPSIEAGSPNPEIPTCFAGITNLLGMLKHSEFKLNVPFVIVHQNFLHPKLGNLQEVSREAVHIYIIDQKIFSWDPKLVKKATKFMIFAKIS